MDQANSGVTETDGKNGCSAARVLVLEDDPFARTGIEFQLSPPDFEVRSTDEPAQFMEWLQEWRPEVTINDLKLGTKDVQYLGLECLSKAKQTSPQVKCVVVTGFSNVINFRRALLAGADAFVIKKTGGVSLRDVVRTVLAGGRYYDPELVQEIMPLVDEERLLHKGRLSTVGEDAGVTRREIEVLQELRKSKSDQDIAEALGISRDTVKTHLASVYKKLGAGNRREAVEIAIAKQIL